MTPRSVEYQEFLASLTVNSVASMENLDLGALRALSGVEHREAEDLLLDRLRSENDPRVPRGLVAMGSSRAAQAFRQLLAKTTYADQTTVAAAEGLWQLTQDPAAIAELVKMLNGVTTKEGRVVAAHALAELGAPGGAAADHALLQALARPEAEVRTAAQLALIAKYRLGDAARVPRSRLYRALRALDEPLESVRRPALADLQTIVDGLRAGQGAASLGLATAETDASPEMERFQQSAWADRGEVPEVDVAALRALRGDERAWGEFLLAWLLGKEDPRAARAIAQIGWSGAVPMLQEVMAAGQGEIVDAARAALQTLGAPSP